MEENNLPNPKPLKDRLGLTGKIGRGRWGVSTMFLRMEKPGVHTSQQQDPPLTYRMIISVEASQELFAGWVNVKIDYDKDKGTIELTPGTQADLWFSYSHKKGSVGRAIFDPRLKGIVPGWYDRVQGTKFKLVKTYEEIDKENEMIDKKGPAE